MIGISSCLLGEKVRFDGGHKLHRYLKETLGPFVEWVPACPKVECGLPIPREAIHLVGDPESPRLLTVRTGKPDRPYAAMGRKKTQGTGKTGSLRFSLEIQVSQFGNESHKGIFSRGHAQVQGTGIFARAFMEYFPLLPVEDEVRPSDPCLRENFIERVLVFRRRKDFMHKGGTVKDLVSFHTDHKLLVLSHSPKHYRTLGALVATAREFNPEHLHPEYLSILTEGLRMHTTLRKNTNALQRINWVFQRSVNAGREKKSSWR